MYCHNLQDKQYNEININSIIDKIYVAKKLKVSVWNKLPI